MEKIPFQVWSLQGELKKAFLSSPDVKEVIKKANSYGIIGTKLVLESTGSEITDNEILEYYANKDKIFMLVNEHLGWESESTMQTQMVEVIQTPIIESVKPCTSNKQDISYKNERLESTNTIAKDPLNFPIENTKFKKEFMDCSEETYDNNIDDDDSVEDGPQYSFDNYTTGHDNSANYSNHGPSSSFDINFIDTNTIFETNTSTSTVLNPSVPVTMNQGHDLIKFSNFKIPWEKMPEDVLRLLKSGQPLGKRIKSFVNLIIDELREISTHLPIVVVRTISNQVIQKYPDSFTEYDAQKNIVLRTPITLITTMKNRNNFLNRERSKYSASRKSSYSGPERKVALRDWKKCNTLKTTCQNWEPNASPDNNMLKKQKQLKTLYSKEELNDEENQNISKYMTECYAQQRYFLNDYSESKPDIEKIRVEWPFLFKRQYLFQHFKQLMSIEPQNFEKRFNSKKMFVVKYFLTSNNEKIRQVLFEKNNDAGIIEAIVAFFRENVDNLFQFFKKSETFQEIITKNPSLTPWIALIGDEFTDDMVLHIIINKTKVVTYKSSEEFLNVVMETICYYYVLNIEFPREITQTLEFLMRYLMSYHAETFRGKKKSISNVCKVLNFLKKLNEFEKSDTDTRPTELTPISV